MVPELLDRLAEAYELAGHVEHAVSAWLTAAAERDSRHRTGRAAAPGRGPGIGGRTRRRVPPLPERGCHRTGGRRARSRTPVTGADAPASGLPVW
jgi:hypothetical protein